ncbi:hypothetical protein [Faecalibacterium sp. OF04-11AC]|uniref:hypothetical protein n=1 Tax=Faecalibacterium sp. OF04-11AC TaxID=2293109 RepID=UPI000FE18C32|nr:hypothetical protein [Faecalibacterium sp. OF04-11AC]
MIQKRFVSLLLCAALALCLLAGCDTAASGSTGSASAPANSSASASSESVPSTTNEANTSGLRPNFDENSLFSITGTSDAFEPCLAGARRFRLLPEIRAGGGFPAPVGRADQPDQPHHRRH